MAIYEKHDWVDCEKCGQSRREYQSCANCAKKERLSGLSCPACKGSDIEEGAIRSGNGIIGPGYNSIAIFQHLFCLDCGNIFYNAKNFKSKNVSN